MIFAFGGNALIATSFYVVQRTCRARLAGDIAPWFVVLGLPVLHRLAGTGYLLGITQSKEYAEPEWYADLWLTVVWVAYLLVFLGTIMQAQGAAHLRGELVLPRLHRHHRAAARRQQPGDPGVALLGSKSLHRLVAGVQDAMVQWWYGHNAVGFFLTAGFLGMMYYFVPKQAERPVYSYRLSIVHFWALIFLYIWAGPHHLHYTALPDWAQTLGMVFSIMLWMPSWGGMINGLMTLSGAWDKLRTDPVLRMIVVVASRFYGMATFEGPMMSIKAVNSLSHYTDWTIGHVHSGALGWVGYDLVRRALLPGAAAVEPRASSTRCSSSTGTSGSRPSASCSTSPRCGSSGIMQGLMWRAYTELGFLEYSLRRDRRGDAPVLRHPRARRRAVPRRRADHGLEPLEDRRRDASVRAPPAPSGAARRPNKEARPCRSGPSTRSSRRTRSSC